MNKKRQIKMDCTKCLGLSICGTETMVDGDGACQKFLKLAKKANLAITSMNKMYRYFKNWPLNLVPKEFAGILVEWHCAKNK